MQRPAALDTDVDVIDRPSYVVPFRSGSNRVQYLIAFALSFGYMAVGCHLGWPSPVLLQLVKQNATSHISGLTGGQANWVVAIMSLGQLIFTPAAGVLSNQNEIRGRMATSFLVMLNLGIVFEYLVGPSMSYQALAACSAVPLVVFTLSFVLAPESPVYLVAMGEHHEAVRSLMTLRCRQNPQDVQEELLEIDQCMLEDPITLKEILKKGSIYKIAFISTGLTVLRAFSGLDAVINYCSEILQIEHIGTIGSVEVALSQLVASAVVPLLVDRCGRRPLLTLSALSSSAFLVGLAIATDSVQLRTKRVFLPLLIGFVMSQTSGWAALTMTVIAEISSPHLRSDMMMCAYMLLAGMTAVIDILYLELSDSLGEAALFSIFAVSCLFAAAFVIAFVPETKGRSMLEIQHQIQQRPFCPTLRWPCRGSTPGDAVAESF